MPFSILFASISNGRILSRKKSVPLAIGFGFLQGIFKHQVPVSNSVSLLSSLPKWQKFRLLENIAGKGKNAGNQHFLIFPLCFLSFHGDISHHLGFLQFIVCQMLQFGTSLKFCCLAELNSYMMR